MTNQLSTQQAALARTRDDRFVVLPFYLVCDVSGSMAPHIDTVNTSLREFRDSLAKDPILSDKVQFGVLDFADDARTVIPLGDFTAADLEHRRLAARGGTSYAAGLWHLRATIEEDVAAGADRHRYFRPAVFFLTDGYPNPGDPWAQAFQDLTYFDSASGQGFRPYPLFVPFGIGDADPEILAQMVYPQDRSALFMAKKGTTPGAAIEKMARAMLMSVLASGRSAAAGQPQHMVPTQADVGPGVTAYPGGDFVS
ncbi:VWA domain-containing protein [Mycolicibacterium sp. jd]|uniref:vWA domain-containing protein n=1 Tax=unclassified Mycolicibacterium TaxID=2636767 RepID=UPI00351BA188